MSSEPTKELWKRNKMIRQYFVCFKEKLDISEVENVISALLGVDNIRKKSDNVLTFYADDILKNTISKSIHTLSNDLDSSLLILVSPENVPLSEYVLKKLSLYHSEGFYSLSQGVIELITKKDEFIKNHLFSWFSGLEYSLALTGKTYIENGFSISKSCVSLSLHRNTMEYRLKKIYELYGLDLHSFDDGILFLIYLSLSGICA